MKNKMRFFTPLGSITKGITLIAFLLVAVLITACDKSDRSTYDRNESIKLYEYDGEKAEKINVGLILPLSGKFSIVGKGMLDAAALCVYDYAGPNVNLVIEDSRGSVSGSVEAFNRLKQNGVDMVLGPVFARNVKAVKKIRGNTPVIAFSSDIRLKEPGLFIFGHDVNEQIDAVFSYASAEEGIKNTILILSDDEYGKIINDYVRANQTTYGISVIETVFLDKDLSKTGKKVKEIIDLNRESGVDIESMFIPFGGIKLKLVVDAMTYAGVDIKGIGIKTKEEEKAEKIKKRELEKLMRENPDFIPIGEDGEPININDDRGLSVVGGDDGLLTGLLEDGEGKQELKPILLMGTSQWMNKQTLGSHFIVGGIFAGPKKISQDIAGRFKNLFKKEMSILDALCFDAVYVSAIIANKYGKIKESYLINQEGFDLSQGEFAFTPYGDTKRKLLIYKVARRGFDIIKNYH